MADMVGGMSIRSIPFLLLFSTIYYAQTVSSKYVKGTIKSKEDWEFIARFCFLSEKGSLRFKFHYPAAEVQNILLYYDDEEQWPAVYKTKTDYGVQNILLYFDDDAQWPSVYKTSKTCSEKEGVLIKQHHQKLELSVYNEYLGCYMWNKSGLAFYSCGGLRIFQSARTRWWFLVVSNCHGSQNCRQKEAVLDPANNQVIELSLNYQWSGCTLVQKNSTTPIYTCEGGRTFRSYRQRWWFIAVSNCAGTKGVALDYELWMTNGDKNDLFRYQFSADEFYILEVDIAFMCVLALLFVLSIYVANKLSQRQLFHTTFKMYMMSIAFEVLHMLFMCLGYGVFASSGYQGVLDSLKLVGRIFESIGLIVFLLMLILMAKGYTITRGRLSQSGTIKITVFITVYVITYCILFLYEAMFFDPGLVLYLYESPAGYGLLALRLIGWVWFCYATFFTLKHYPEKSTFYYPFFIVYTIWFWAGPIVILVSMHAMPLWIREKVVNGVENAVTLVGHLIFLMLTRPSAANSNFPYHVRTTQIGILNTGQESAGQPMNTMTNPDNFTAHAYAPSTEPPAYSEYDQGEGNRRFTDIFTVTNKRNSDTNGAVNMNKFPRQHQPIFQPA